MMIGAYFLLLCPVIFDTTEYIHTLSYITCTILGTSIDGTEC